MDIHMSQQQEVRETHFYYSKRKIWLKFALLALLELVAIGAAYYFYGSSAATGGMYFHRSGGAGFLVPSMSIFSLVMVCVILLAVGLLSFAGFLIRKRPCATLSLDGITMSYHGLIPWHEIASVHLMKLHGTTMIGMKLKGDSLYETQLSWWKRLLYRINRSFCDIDISLHHPLTIPSEDALIILHYYHEAAQRREQR